MPDRTAEEALRNQFPDVPAQYRGFIRPAITKAESILRDPNSKDAIPGSFKNVDHVPSELVEAVISRESGWNPQAVNMSGYCNNRGGRATGLGQFCLDPGGNPAGSLELSDYETLTGKQVSPSDVYDPQKAITLVAFGLGDRYERMKTAADDRPKNWIKAVEGYSPVPGNSQATQDYEQDIYNIIETYHGKKRAEEIATKAGGNSSTDTCGFFDIGCHIQHAKDAAHFGVDVGTSNVGNVLEENAKAYITKMGIFLVGALAIGFGILLLAKKPAGQALQTIKDNPELLLA